MDDDGSNVEVVCLVDDGIEWVSVFLLLVNNENEEGLNLEAGFVGSLDVCWNMEVLISLVDDETEEVLVIV